MSIVDRETYVAFVRQHADPTKDRPVEGTHVSVMEHYTSDGVYVASAFYTSLKPLSLLAVKQAGDCVSATYRIFPERLTGA